MAGFILCRKSRDEDAEHESLHMQRDLVREHVHKVGDTIVDEVLEDCDETPVFKIVPRDDQKPVLDYESGSMAISAVPGAGKTTILLALIMKLINIEIKPPKKDSDLVKKVVEEINKYGIVDNSIVSCFDPECVRLVKEIDKNVKTALLYENDELGNEIMRFGVAKYCKQLNVNAAHPHRKLIKENEVVELHNLGMAVNPWTVNLEEDIIRLTEWGCDALISDVPDYCRKVLEGIK